VILASAVLLFRITTMSHYYAKLTVILSCMLNCYYNTVLQINDIDNTSWRCAISKPYRDKVDRDKTIFETGIT